MSTVRAVYRCRRCDARFEAEHGGERACRLLLASYAALEPCELVSHTCPDGLEGDLRVDVAQAEV